ncbi:intestinal mucin-like protein [Rhinatrema bivittatum]|uniref:intestinal mucin-like protein n=1 Tax=Rhinatrema bivittatum TaxID=194408 RepID=UPI00112EEFEC|nr:intestinal mucin-like protein [Rhinatrema bivittatum]
MKLGYADFEDTNDYTEHVNQSGISEYDITGIEKTSSCRLREYEDYISHNKCKSLDKVSIPRCEGSCGTFSMYSAEASSMSHKCTCCQEAKTSSRQVQLHCPDGSHVTHRYTYVERCNCINTNCERVALSQQDEIQENNEQATPGITQK